jgi:hypothetical protein
VGDNHGAGVCEDAFQLFNNFRLLGFLHCALLFDDLPLRTLRP